MTTETEILESAETLGEVVRRLRELRGFSLRALATKVELSAPFLSDLEHNRRSTDRLPALAEALGIDVEALKRFDKRLTVDLRRWMEQNPELSAVLDNYRQSGKPVEKLLQALRTSPKKPAPRGR